MTISRREIKRITEDYHRYFPDWKIINLDTLAREDGPVLQGILFDRSARDIYRPTGFIRVLTAPDVPGVMELAHRLNRPNRLSDWSVRLQSHEKERDRIVEELHRQLTPSIERPLVASEVLKLYEREAVPNGAEAYSLATLCAYFGHDKNAREWCTKFRDLTEWLKDDFPKHVLERQAFLDSLERWLDEGTARQRLEEVLQEERRKLGLVP